MSARLLTAGDAATYLGVSAYHFAQVIAPSLPRVTIGASDSAKPRVRYDVRDLDAWIDANKSGAA